MTDAILQWAANNAVAMTALLEGRATVVPMEYVMAGGEVVSLAYACYTIPGADMFSEASRYLISVGEVRVDG